MIYYKKLNPDGTLNMIGTQETLPTDAVEINATEYKELYQLCYEVIKQAQLLPLVAVSYHPNSIDLEKSHE